MNPISPYPYNPFMQPFPAYQPPRPSLPQQQVMTVASIDSFTTIQAAPNSQFLALHQTEPILYCCQSDGAGKLTVTAYDIAPHKSPEQVAQANIETQMSAISERLKRVEEYINGKPDLSSSDEQPARSNNRPGPSAYADGPSRGKSGSGASTDGRE